MGRMEKKHEYDDPLPFTEPVGADEDTKPFEYKQTWQEAHRRRIARDFDEAIRSAEEAERLYTAFLQGDIVLTSEEGIALYERVYGETHGALLEEPQVWERNVHRQTNFVAEGLRSAARGLNALATWFERGA